MTRTFWLASGVVAVGLAAAAIGWFAGRRSQRPEAKEPAPRAQTRARVGPAIERPRPPAPSPAWEQDLRDPDPVVRARALASGDADDATLLDALRDADLNVSGIASEALVRRYREGAFSTRELAALYGDTGLALKPRIALLNGIAEQPGLDAAELLVEVLESGRVEERRAAATLIARQDAATAVPALVGALGDEDADVRSHARDSLRELARGRDFGDDAAAWTAWWRERGGR